MDSYNPEKWTILSNEALKIALVSDSAAVFPPAFTYPIFGEHEQIFGYTGLQINLAFNATTMRPLLGLKYAEKMTETDTVKAEDPQAKLLEFLPKESLIINDESAWAEECEKEIESFNIPGELVGSYSSGGNEYNIYKSKLSDPATLELHKRMQIFVLLFIEAGSYIDPSDDKWDLYFVYEKTEKAPKLISFCTVYNYWYYPGLKQFDAKYAPLTRKKILQFVVLPPYQGHRHGAGLYKHLIEEWLRDDSVAEIVVEDPSEVFDDLRDRCDLERLSKDGLFDQPFTNLPLEDEAIAKLQKQYKMEKRQFARCLEMGLLHMDKTQKVVSKRGLRLQIKKRLYLKNKEALDEMEKPEKMDKLQGAYQSLVDDYFRIMEKVEFSKKRGLEEPDSQDDGSKRLKNNE